MSYVMVDVEADGPTPGHTHYSMIELGAVWIPKGCKMTEGLPTFHRFLKPISSNWKADALKVTGYTREQTMQFPDAVLAMSDFYNWLYHVSNEKRFFFISDNNGFDWQFVNWYFHEFIGSNPFGHSSTNLGSLYKGMHKSMFVNHKHLRKTKHTHNPVDDAMSNAEAFVTMMNMGLKVAK